MNSTFLALIPKKQKLTDFGDFIPISCCNVVYKLIAKIIAQRMKSILSQIILEEQFGFLFNRQIHDTVSLAQEAIHLINKYKLKAFSLKHDLSKAYDRVNWTFLRLLLIQLGFSIDLVNLIMGCVTSTSFTVLINGTPSSFFRPLRGLTQGCPLSPFIFLLVAEALSRIIHNVKENMLIKGIKVSSTEEVTHTLFVDDVLVFGEGTIRNLEAFASLIDKYKKATGMVVNMEKSNLIHNDFSADMIR